MKVTLYCMNHYNCYAYIGKRLRHDDGQYTSILQ
jgi:hypothetical protein